ncbi:MAG: PIN domain-containing protein [Gemmatimonadetes bacterium]|nr:PIN domain-containing protein [Gemmatimonadota bacterium]
MISPRTPVVHLDTSFLIRALVAGSEESQKLRAWLRQRRPVAVSTVTWGEFLCGPLGEADRATARRIAHTHVPVGTEEITEAARLFNHGGRRRGSFPDCVIAGTAIVSGAELATSNAGDFERFVDAGLTLAA